MSAFALQLPNSYVEIDNDEMEYVDGGAWNSFRGTDAINEIENIAAVAFGLGTASYNIAKSAIAGASTGVAVAVAIAVGMGISMAAAAATGALCIAATTLYLRDGGFQANSFAAFGRTAYIGVKSL